MAITGFMGCGKTTVARNVAALLHCEVVDLDERIEDSQKRSVREIIETDGEEQFRKIETEQLRAALTGGADVISLGGGAWMVAANRELLKEYGVLTVWLDAPFDVCWKRISETREGRPLARNQQMAQQLYDERRPVYGLADLRVGVEETQKAGELAEQIASILTSGR